MIQFADLLQTRLINKSIFYSNSNGHLTSLVISASCRSCLANGNGFHSREVQIDFTLGFVNSFFFKTFDYHVTVPLSLIKKYKQI